MVYLYDVYINLMRVDAKYSVCTFVAVLVFSRFHLGTHVSKVDI